MQTFHMISENVSRREICCGDFNAHNTLWGSDHTDNNGEIVLRTNRGEITHVS